MEECLPDPWTLIGILLGWWSLWEARKRPAGKHRKTKPRKKYRRGERGK